MNEYLQKDSINKKLLISCCIFSILVLVSSYSAQYLWKIEPCQLCKFQRIPYFFLTLLTMVGLNRFDVIKIPIICLFLISAILSLYHLLVIGEFVKDFCAVQANVESLEDFMAMLDVHVPCSKAGWKILGIPVAGYNLLFSLIFVFFFSKYFKKATFDKPVQNNLFSI